MKRLFGFVLLLSIAAFAIGCGPKHFINENYEFNRPASVIKLAILPTSIDDPTLLDSLFVQIFESSDGGMKIVPPAMLRKELAQDSLALEVMITAFTSSYSKEQLQAGVNFESDLSSDNIALLKSKLDSADLVLVPVEFGIKSMGIATTGRYKMRLFDLRTGELVYEKSMSLSVEMGGDSGRAYLAIGLIGFAKDDYNKLFWDKFVNRS